MSYYATIYVQGCTPSNINWMKVNQQATMCSCKFNIGDPPKHLRVRTWSHANDMTLCPLNVTSSSETPFQEILFTMLAKKDNKII